MSAKPTRAADAPRTLGEMLALAREFLERKATGEPRLEAELLVAHALGLTRLEVFLQLDRPVVESELARARELLVRRGKREPVAYIRGAREFYGRAFRVDRSVLIPRPETELVVDVAREIAKSRGAPARVADVGTGSGCLAITLALELPAASVHAVDISIDALAVARGNAEQLGARVEFVLGDGPRALSASPPFDLVVSNPPYIDPRERASLEPDVRDFEPALALFTPDADPDHWLRRLLGEGVELLASGGTMLVELGDRQAARALALAAERGLAAQTRKDYAGTERVLVVTR